VISGIMSFVPDFLTVFCIAGAFIAVAKSYDPSGQTLTLVQMTPEINKPQSVRGDNESVVPHQPVSSIVISNTSLIDKLEVNTTHTSHKPNPQAVINSPISSILGSAASLPLGPLRILTAPLRNLVMLSFEGYRQLLKNAERIEDSIRQSLGLSKRVRLRSLDPLALPEPVVLENRDRSIPMLGKMVFTMSEIAVSGLSNFRVEELDSSGRNLQFQHLIPRLDSIANYTIDYHLFDVIPFRVSEGSLIARVPNARVRGSFQMFPDLLNVWFRVAQLNLTTWVEDLDIHFYPRYLISDRFAIDRNTVDKIHTAFNHFLPNVTELLKLTYTKAIEMRLV
jgi:hypothetical protein